MKSILRVLFILITLLLGLTCSIFAENIATAAFDSIPSFFLGGGGY